MRAISFTHASTPRKEQHKEEEEEEERKEKWATECVVIVFQSSVQEDTQCLPFPLFLLQTGIVCFFLFFLNKYIFTMFLSLSLVQTVTHLCNTTYTVSYSLVLAYQVLNIKRVLGNSWHTFFSFVFVSQTPADADVVVVVVVDYCTHCTSRSTHDSILRTYLYFTACAPQVNGSISSSPLCYYSWHRLGPSFPLSGSLRLVRRSN